MNKNKKLIIGIDIDDTMTNLTEFLVAFGEQNGGKLKQPINKTSLKELFDWDDSEKLDLWKNNIEYITSTISTRPLVKETLQEMKRRNYDIYLISTRGSKYYKDARKATINWLNKNEIIYDKLILTEEKDKACLEYNVDIYIDDRPNTCDALLNIGIKTFIFDNVFNKEYSNNQITRIYSFPGFLNAIEKNY